MPRTQLAIWTALCIGLLSLASPAKGQSEGNRDLVLLDFFSESCGPCRSMEGTVGQLMAAGYPIRKVNINQSRELARQFQVTVVPAFVLVDGGREVGRLEGAQNAADLQSLFAKARPSSADARASQSPRSAASAATSWTSVAAGPGGSSSSGSQSSTSTMPAPVGSPFIPSGNPFAGSKGASPSAAMSTSAAGSPSQALSSAACLAASVRLTVEDATGFSYGSGTLIDSRSGEALILTCGHIFRESKGKGKITVDLFGANPQSKLPGQVIGYDLKRDIGLVSIRPRGLVATAPVAPSGHQARVGDRVVSVGCDNGADPTPRESRVTRLNKFLGPANVEVAGQPTQGRSGGGLFSANGYVIGVCNAADPADNEGMYAATPVIHEQLDQMGLAAIYRRPSANPASLATSGAAGTAGGGAANASGPSMPARMPPSALSAWAGAPGAAMAMNMANAAVAGLADSDLASRAAAPLTPQEQATLGALAQKGQNAEVICIVRPLNDPQAKSEVIILDRATPAFLRQLSAERSTQDARHLTSLEVARDAGVPPVASPPAARSQATTAPVAGNIGPSRAWRPNWR